MDISCPSPVEDELAEILEYESKIFIKQTNEILSQNEFLYKYKFFSCNLFRKSQ